MVLNHADLFAGTFLDHFQAFLEVAQFGFKSLVGSVNCWRKRITSGTLPRPIQS